VATIGGDIANLWLRGEAQRREWRRAHKVLEWDGWEEGLVYRELGIEAPSNAAAVNSLNVPLNFMKLL
jgi:hypothetical protein